MKKLAAKYPAALESALAKPVSDHRGVVLIAVLWICALITWFAFQISAETRIQGESQLQSIRKSQSYYLAVGGCYEALARMGQPLPLHAEESPDLNWQPDGKPRLVRYDTGQAVVIIEPEEQKVNVNKANQPLLKQVLGKAGADEASAEHLADLIMDFIDQDNSPRLHGGENDYYKRLGLNYGPFNGHLTSLDQLLLIPGLTQKLFYAFEGGGNTSEAGEKYEDLMVPGKYSLFSLLTIYGGGARPPSLDEETAARPVSWRLGGIYRILSFGIGANGPPSTGIWLTVRFSPQDRGSYKILSRKVL